jgi:hypothetical protein
VGYGVDTLILNMRYTDEQYHPIKKELSEEITYELDELQETVAAISNSVSTAMDG